MKRVVVTGMGIVSPLGVGVDYVWEALINSKSGIRATSGFDASFSPSKVAGEVPVGEEKGQFLITNYISEKEAKRTDKFIHYAIAAAEEAVQDSGINNLSEEEKLQVGVNIGSGIGGLFTIFDNAKLIENDGYRKISPFFIPASLINLPSGHVSIKYGFKGPNLAPVTACATGTHSISDAYRLIKCNEANVMVAGGSEAPVNALGVAGFARMNALSTAYNDTPEQASRPWDKGRDGFVISEGAGVFILEELEHAKKRGAKIYAEVVGCGMSGDANHITAPSSEGEGAARCMNIAVKMANIQPQDIGYINAHGTSTPLGDMAEVTAVKKIFKENIKHVSMSSTKSAIGHLLGAAGAVEAIFSTKALMTGILPPTLNLNNSEDVDNLDLIPLVAKEKSIEYAMSNSFGFGGTNGTIILKKFKG